LGTGRAVRSARRPEFLHAADIETLFASEYEVHFNSARTGVRLVGPKPHWARTDGGEAGLHPSNIHDNAYAVGAIDFTGDMPIILGPDGPSLGGFVCPAVIAQGELWKIGQLKPGDKIRFRDVTPNEAVALKRGTPVMFSKRIRKVTCCASSLAMIMWCTGAPAMTTYWSNMGRCIWIFACVCARIYSCRQWNRAAFPVSSI
jgi:allophanate hydrolase subunit 2